MPVGLRIMRSKFISLSFIGAVLLALLACAPSENQGATVAETGSSNTAHSPPMKYTTVAAANAQGFARVSLGTGGDYAEGIIDANGKEVIAPRTELLVNSIDGRTALVQIGRGFVFVDLEQQRVDPTLLDRAKVYQFAEPYSCGLAMVRSEERRVGKECRL